MFRAVAFVALVASGLIALSSCTSGQPAPTASKSATTSAPPTQPAGSTTAAASMNAAASASTASVRIGLLTEVFATPLPDDPATAKVIEGFRESQILWDQSTQQRVIVASTTDYVTGQALANLQAAVSASAKDFVALAGTDRLYDTNAASVTSDSATVTSCDDGSKTNIEDLATGQKIPNNPSALLPLFVTWQLVPTAGHWAITTIRVVSSPDPRAKACDGFSNS